MTPTREQLELAAKAAGLDVFSINDLKGTLKYKVPSASMAMQFKTWQPITDKSDSFDLMVAIGGGHIAYFQGKIHFYTEDETACAALADHNNDKGLATMLAVFLCAVEIGRAM